MSKTLDRLSAADIAGDVLFGAEADMLICCPCMGEFAVAGSDGVTWLVRFDRCRSLSRWQGSQSRVFRLAMTSTLARLAGQYQVAEAVVGYGVVGG
jgi:hypothetical protein